ncbi:TlpA family protein disulfide reductase [Chitinophaga vietnamensis]|uniref:TlpA family protein disulfide reductase n=1 Tax=Chitinophaga vietnamensis TaxID=2593957 RepID=UPI0011787428|nr:TlpA disulfide reductase family protein [Chitinophaga vietnamensis]
MRWLSCFLLLLLMQHLSANAQKHAKISGRIDGLKIGDTVQLKVYDYGYYELRFLQQTFTAVVKNDGYFSFDILNLSYPHYIQVIPSVASLTSDKTIQALLESGDSIVVTTNANGYTYSGRGAAKFRYAQMYHAKYYLFWGDAKEMRYGFEKMDSTNRVLLRYLESHRADFSEAAFTMLIADLLGAAEVDKGIYVSFRDIPNDSLYQWLNGYSNDNGILLRTYPYPQPAVLQYSSLLGPGIIQYFQLNNKIMGHSSPSVQTIYDSLVHYAEGGLRSRLLSSYIYQLKDVGQDVSNLVNDALSYITTDNCRTLIENIKRTRVRGEPAFSFSLPDTAGVFHHLESLRNKVVVLDFWFTGCYSCQELVPYLKIVMDKFNNGEVVFVSISIDADRNKWICSVQDGRYGPSNALHLFTAGMGGEHEVITQYNITGYPTLLIIDKNGKLGGIPKDPRSDNGVGMINMINQALLK